MPALPRGVYEKHGYSKQFEMNDELFQYEASGQTRMLYRSVRRPELVAKVMPSQRSNIWREGWDQNSKEARILGQLSNIWFVPKVHAHDECFAFINKWGEPDTMDVLVMDSLGQDLQKAAEALSAHEYLEAYCSCLWAVSKFSTEGVVVHDPHPFNCCLMADERRLALPCDFGECSPPTTTILRKSLKHLLNGLKNMASSHYGVTMGMHDIWSLINNLPENGVLDSECTDKVCTAVRQAWNQASSAGASPLPEVKATLPPDVKRGPMPSSTQMPSHSGLSAGHFAHIHGLRSQSGQALNGQVCFVRDVCERVQVRLVTQELKSIESSNLVPAVHPRNAWVCCQCRKDVYWLANPDNTWTGRNGKWRCGGCSKARAAPPPQAWAAPPPQVVDPPAPPPPPTPPPVVAPVLPMALIQESNTHPDKHALFTYLAWLKQNKNESERKLFYKQYLLEHHPDHHMDWRESEAMVDFVVHQTSLCDYAKRLKKWLVSE